MASQNNSVGYMVIEGTEGQLRGIALVTDARGIPLDFRYTDLIRPNKLERILYGDSFDTYVKEELILESLIDSMETDPQLWICNDKDILTPLRTISRTKTVLLEDSAHAPLDAAGNIENTSDPRVFLIQTGVNGAPFRAEFSEGARTDEVQQTAAMLTENAKTMALLEPFSRLQRLVSALAAGSD